MRLLFSSIHCYLDLCSGAALCRRELLEMLASRRIDCRVITAGVLDYERETTLDVVLGGLELPAPRLEAALGERGMADVIDLNVSGAGVTLLPMASSRPERSPDPRESALNLDLADQFLDKFQEALGPRRHCNREALGSG
jgi:hypothetical protein